MTAAPTLRAATEADLGAATALMNAASRAWYGVDDLTETDLKLYFDSPNVEPARDVRLADRDGTVVGYADVFDENAWHTRYWFDVRLHPTEGDEAVAAALVGWLEARAAGEAKPGAFLRGFVQAENEAAKRVLEEKGYALIRHSYRMAIDLPEEVAEPGWPDGIDVRTMLEGEERAVYEVNEECFADHWEHEREPFEEWAHWALGRESFDPTLWFLALDEGQIAGYALCRPWEAEPGMGWVDSLGVRRPWRRRGLAQALLRHVFREFAGRGFRKVGLGVDAQSLTGANVLYERVGMHVVRRFDVYQRELP